MSIDASLPSTEKIIFAPPGEIPYIDTEALPNMFVVTSSGVTAATVGEVLTTLIFAPETGAPCLSTTSIKPLFTEPECTFNLKGVAYRFISSLAGGICAHEFKRTKGNMLNAKIIFPKYFLFRKYTIFYRISAL